jgi:hypothetical protein
MTPLVIALIAAPFVFWLFRRRTGLRADEERPEQRPAMTGTIAEKTDAAALLEVEPSAGHKQFEVSEQAEETPEQKQAAAAHAGAGNDSAPSEREPDGSSGQEAGEHLPVDSADAKPTTRDRAGQSDPVPPPSPENIVSPPLSEVSDGREEPEVGSGISAGEYSSGEPAASTSAAPPPPGVDVEAGEAFQETEVAAEAAVHAPEDALPQDPEHVPSSEAGGHQPPATDIEISGAAGQNTLDRAASAAVIATPAPNNNTQDGHTPETEVTPGEEPPSTAGADEPAGNGAERAPLPYRPPPQRQPRQAATRVVNQEPERAVRSEAPLEIRVRLILDRFSFCQIGLLPERKPDMDDEVMVKAGGMPLQLVAQEKWYEDLRFENIGERLQQGLRLAGFLADHRRVQWQLSGRGLYVLAGHPRASGFVSATRLVLGRSHVVLCVAGLLQQVESVLNEAGCQGYTKLDESQGMPPGWVGLRGVSPEKAISLDAGSDPFYAIKPAPDIEIELDGGVRWHDSVWLAGYPPRIKLFGQATGEVKVLIDGREAWHTEDGCFVVDGYDLSGEHSVYCEGLSCSRSYSIEEPADSWQQWPAYHFGEADICGPLVQLPHETASRRAFTVPMSNLLLLGAEPGQIFRCSSRSGAHWKGFVPFDVVWALPAQPLICDKKSARILRFSDAPLAVSKRHARPALSWCSAILDASRKGLRIANAAPDSTARWIEYKKAARNIWRGRR